jgi:outer membrane protein OmpA-like peptidoglycan-associated protein
MPSNSQPKAYRYRCKACQDDITVPFLNCGTCGLVHGYFESDTPASGPAADYKVVCEKCFGELADQPLNDECKHCGEIHAEWWNVKKKLWLQPNLELREADLNKRKAQVWIKGDFDGKYTGNKKKGSQYHHGVDARIYGEINIGKGGKLRNVERIDAPPFKIADDEHRPIRQDDVVDVGVLDELSGQYVDMELHDFRLHRYESIGRLELSSTNQLVGRIVGKAYGHITPKNLEPELPPIDKTGSLGKGGLGASNPETLKDAPIPPTTLDAPTIPYKPCLSCSFWLLALLSIVLWIACSWKLALVGFLSVKFVCWLDKWLFVNNKKIKSKTTRIVLGFLLLLLSCAGFFFFNELMLKDNCQHVIWWPLLLPFVALLIAAWLYSCLLKLVLTGLWFMALLSWCSAGLGNCHVPQSNYSGLANLSNSFEHIQQGASQLVTHDNAATDVSAASINSPSGRRVSIDEAVSDPSLMKNCKNSIYFSAEASFPTGEAKVLPSAEVDFSKLGKLMRNDFAGRRFVITGYTDVMGDDKPDGSGILYNVSLSERRAEAVVDWLEAHGDFKPGQLEARGAGSKFPISQNALTLKLNRRVEVNLRCDEKKEGGM